MMCVGMKLLICLGILQSNAIEVMKITFDAHVQGDTDDDGDEDYVQSTDALSGLDKSFFCDCSQLQLQSMHHESLQDERSECA